MSSENGYSYRKLTKTPLATATKICGREPKVIAIILGIVSILIDIIPTVVLAIHILGEKLPEIDFFDTKHTFEEQTEQHQNIPRIICAVIGILFSVVHLVGIVVLIIGALRNNTRYYYCWFCSMFCHIFMGKLAFASIMFTFEALFAGIVLSLVLLDIPLIMFMFVALGRTASIARNSRYLTTNFGLKSSGTVNTPIQVLSSRSNHQQLIV